MNKDNFRERIHEIFDNFEALIKDPLALEDGETYYSKSEGYDTPEKVLDYVKSRLDGIADGSSPYNYYVEVKMRHD